jgi:alpha-tubulin suppressor-like RCC1 family protein
MSLKTTIMYKTKLSLSFLGLITLVAGCRPDSESSLDGTTKGTPCSVEENDDGTVTIECPDGSSVTVCQGDDGTRGRDGTEGESGMSGKPGADGKDGEPGENGQAGQDGELGESGETGKDGEPGENGQPGQDGETGHEGPEGQPGPIGAPGANGQEGEPGRLGEAGVSCSVECVDEQTVRTFCEDGSEVSYQVESCKMAPRNLLSARGQHGCWVVQGDLRLICWGSDSDGQLGNGAINSDQARANLVDARQLDAGLNTRWRSVETGRNAACGITVAGDAYCWGFSLALGNGGLSSNIPTPVDVSALSPGTTWSVISPGSDSAGNFSCGVTSQGAAHCWGSDTNGNLGNGPDLTTTQMAPSPVDISALPPETTWSTISTGSTHACGITTESVAYCWGSDADGKLGNGPEPTSIQESPFAVDVSALPPETDWTAITAGLSHACALTAEGQVYCWGSDANGQLGNGAVGAATSPSLVDMAALSEGLTFVQVSAGEQHTCAVASDGSAWCWGNRASGRLGDGSSLGSAASPVAVDVSLLPAGTTWKTLSAGFESTCGLTTNDDVYCWGNDSRGQLGIGAIISLPQLRPRSAVAASIVVLTEHSEFSGAVGASNPKMPLTVLALNGSTEALTVSATSGNASIIPTANITVSGTGSDRLLSFEPIASGLVMITVVVASSQDEYTFRFEYGASGMPPDPTGIYYHHISDASTALDVGGGYVLLGNDESNTLFLHRQDVSGLPLRVWNFTAAEQLGSEELDIEAAARSGDMIVWAASHGNSSKVSHNGALEERRRVIFATKITGSGANVELSFAGRYGGGPGSKSDVAELGLRAELIAWDKANGHGMGADALGFEAATAAGVFPFAPGGFNIEGLEFAANGTTGYLGFRAPTIDVGGTRHALIVPVTNILDLVDGIGEQSGRGQFGAPILLDLAGRSIRELRRNASGEYLISAGPPENATPGVNDNWALYTWAGAGHLAVFNRELPDVDLLTGGTWESIASVPNPLQSGGTVRLVTDSGDAVMYGFEQTKDVELGHQKSYSQLFTLQ